MPHLPNRAFGFQTRAIHSGYNPLEDRALWRRRST
jgi:hypothetical protein